MPKLYWGSHNIYTKSTGKPGKHSGQTCLQSQDKNRNSGLCCLAVLTTAAATLCATALGNQLAEQFIPQVLGWAQQLSLILSSGSKTPWGTKTRWCLHLYFVSSAYSPGYLTSFLGCLKCLIQSKYYVDCCCAVLFRDLKHGRMSTNTICLCF